MSDAYRTTDLSLLAFEGSRVRYHVDTQGLSWWVAADVCAILDIKNVSDACERLDADEKDDIAFNDTVGKRQAYLTHPQKLYRWNPQGIVQAWTIVQAYLQALTALPRDLPGYDVPIWEKESDPRKW